MSKRLYLLDAYALIYRSYYAFIKNPRYTTTGLNTSAIYGFTNTLIDLIEKENPTHIAVVFDPPYPTFRHEIYKEYKANREATPEDIKKSIPFIKDIITGFNIPVIEVERYEADDVIGSLAKQAEKLGFTTFMMTPDKDYGQLVSDNIFMLKPGRGGNEMELVDSKKICEKYMIKNPIQVIDILGLMGDSSDNIPGAPGIGEKTAIKLINEFESIENLYTRIEKIQGKIKEKLAENKDLVFLSKDLATIKLDVPITIDPEELTFQSPDEAKLTKLFNELEFKSILQRVFRKETANTQTSNPIQGSLFTDNAIEKVQTNLKTISTTIHNYELIDDSEKRKKLISELLKQKEICFDTETTGLDPYSSEIVGLSFSFEKQNAYYISFPENQEDTKAILVEFKSVFENPSILKIGQNIKFDLLMLWSYGIELKGNLFDTMIAHYLLQPELRHGMDYLAEIYLRYRTIHYEELVGGKGKNQLDIRFVDVDLLKDYAAEDADITFQLKQILAEELKSNGIENLFYEIEMPLMKVLATIEHNGVRIDTEALKLSSEILTAEAIKIEEEIHEMAGYSFNVASPAQVGEVLFERLKLDEKAKKTKTGQYSTSEDILEKIRSKHPIVGKILDYRGLKKLLSTYIDALPQLVNPKTGKVHTSFNQTVAATGRLSSTNPNLQNIPIRDAQGKEIRRAFIPDEGCVFFSADYSQIELRIMAHLSGDRNMLEAFNSGHDIHTATVAKINKISLEEVTSDMRRKAKTANFGIIYGISVFGLAERLAIPRSEAKELIDGYFATYPDVKKYMDDAILLARENGYVETIFGRKRYLADINSQNSVVRGYAERNAINAPIQGSAADIIKIAMVKIQKRLEQENLKTQMILQVHDELNFSVPKDEIEQAKKIVIEEMQSAITLKVPLIADCGVGANWLEAH